MKPCMEALIFKVQTMLRLLRRTFFTEWCTRSIEGPARGPRPWIQTMGHGDRWSRIGRGQQRKKSRETDMWFIGLVNSQKVARSPTRSTLVSLAVSGRNQDRDIDNANARRVSNKSQFRLKRPLCLLDLSFWNIESTAMYMNVWLYSFRALQLIPKYDFKHGNMFSKVVHERLWTGSTYQQNPLPPFIINV